MKLVNRRQFLEMGLLEGVSTFWVVAPCRTPAMFVAVRRTTMTAAQIGEPHAPSRRVSAA